MEARENVSFECSGQARFRPCDLEAEKIVLSAMLWDREFAATMLRTLQQEAFCGRANALIFESMKRLYEASGDIVWEALFLELDTRKELKDAGSKEYLTGVASRLASHLHAAHYASIIRGKAFLRELLCAMGDISRQACSDNGNAEALLDYAQEELCRLSQKHHMQHFLSAPEILADYQVACGPQKADRLEFIAAGFPRLDKLAGGFKRGELAVLAGRAAHGKTTFALNCALHAGQNGVPVLIFSPETSTHAFTSKMLRILYGLDCDSERQLPVEENMPFSVAKRFASLPIYVSDSRQYIDEVSECANQLAARLEKEAQHRLGLVVVDCLSLLKTTENGDPARIILKRLQELAKSLDVAVLVLHQCEQSVDQPAEIRISTIRDSAAVEEVADTICLLYRERQNDSMGAEESALFSILKQRNGPLGAVHLIFDAKRFIFLERSKDNIDTGKPGSAGRALSWLKELL